MHNLEAAGRVVEALRVLGRLEPVDDARVQAVLSLAAQVDAHPENASLWREYRAAEEALRAVGKESGDPFADLLAELSAEVGDAADSGAKDSGPAVGEDCGAAGAAVDAVAEPRRKRSPRG